MMTVRGGRTATRWSTYSSDSSFVIGYRDALSERLEQLAHVLQPTLLDRRITDHHGNVGRLRNQLQSLIEDTENVHRNGNHRVRRPRVRRNPLLVALPIGLKRYKRFTPG
jgi:hypothetical protein